MMPAVRHFPFGLVLKGRVLPGLLFIRERGILRGPHCQGAQLRCHRRREARAKKDRPAVAGRSNTNGGISIPITRSRANFDASSSGLSRAQCVSSAGGSRLLPADHVDAAGRLSRQAARRQLPRPGAHRSHLDAGDGDCPHIGGRRRERASGASAGASVAVHFGAADRQRRAENCL
jgi:hypothetical protein